MPVVIDIRACAEGSREFGDGTGGSGGSSSAQASSSGMGGQHGTGGSTSAGSAGGRAGAGGVGGTGGSGGAGGSGGTGGSGAAGGAGGCTWIDITMADCSSGIMIADFCPAGTDVSRLERCTDGVPVTPDAAYQMFLLSGCPGVCPVVGNHVAWRRIECCN
jgi:hypothetical protein